MTPKIKYLITADYAGIDETTKKLNVNGFFDSLSIPIFPSEAPKFYFVIGLNNIIEKTLIKFQILNPNNHILAEKDMEISSNHLTGIINSIVDVDKMPLSERGVYTINVILKDTNEILGSYSLIIDYPPQRVFDNGEIESIINNPKLIKNSRVKIICPKCKTVHNLELNLDRNKPISKGYVPFPDSNTIECCDGNKIDLIGLRRHIEWAFGQPIPKKQ